MTELVHSDSHRINYHSWFCNFAAKLTSRLSSTKQHKWLIRENKPGRKSGFTERNTRNGTEKDPKKGTEWGKRGNQPRIWSLRSVEEETVEGGLLPSLVTVDPFISSYQHCPSALCDESFRAWYSNSSLAGCSWPFFRCSQVGKLFKGEMFLLRHFWAGTARGGGWQCSPWHFKQFS